MVVGNLTEFASFFFVLTTANVPFNLNTAGAQMYRLAVRPVLLARIRLHMSAQRAYELTIPQSGINLPQLNM
jgi:hypothetical protein